MFYGCSEFPKCKFATWNKPINKTCEECGSLYLEKNIKNKVVQVCSNSECKNSKGK